MHIIRPASERGHANHGWLDSYHTFSFANYYDPRFMGFRNLRVINEDRVEPKRGFGTHPHRNMEIISYVLEGALEHKDSMGTGSVIRPHDIQRMSAGTGVTHSEFNGSQTERVHFLQIWLVPSQENIKPSYAQKNFAPADKNGILRLIASPEGTDGSVSITSDASVYAGLFGEGQSYTQPLNPSRYGWIQVARGSIKINGQVLNAGDGMALIEESSVNIEGLPQTGSQTGSSQQAEILFFDLG